ncbi:MAG: hypothetical protein HYR49_02015 [Gammaproteobacteria bacterium]|nr:hypothetical protein [Gammaproteobacteria bacterium]
MWVVKLGGSLLTSPWLRLWVDVLADHGAGRVVVVPGGGPFADAVRMTQQRWGIDDAAAHHLALVAMEQHARILCSWRRELVPQHNIEGIAAVARQGRVPVWFAASEVLDANIPASWDVTSDSLAAWLAGRLGAEAVVLVKTPRLGAPAAMPELIREGKLDQWFAKALAGFNGRVSWLAHGESSAMAAGLRSGSLPGVEIRPQSGSLKKMRTREGPAPE